MHTPISSRSSVPGFVSPWTVEPTTPRRMQPSSAIRSARPGSRSRLPRTGIRGNPSRHAERGPGRHPELFRGTLSAPVPVAQDERMVPRLLLIATVLLALTAGAARADGFVEKRCGDVSTAPDTVQDVRATNVTCRAAI